jgi:enoyl-CoA hydratase/carnithine racemase
VFTPADTEQWGLWNGVAADGPAALTEARAYARALATQVAPTSLQVTKRQIHTDVLSADPARAIDESQRLLNEAMATPEYREGVAALREKRPPNF